MRKLLMLALLVVLLPWAAAATDATVRQGDMTFEFSGVQQYGYYLDGVAWVVGEPNQLQLLGTTPVEGLINGKAANGLTLNPKATGRTVEHKQSWDGRVRTYAPSPHTYPISLQINDICVKAISENSGIEGIRHGIIQEYGAVVVVASPPPANAMAPALIGWKGRTQFRHYIVDLDSIVMSLPNLDAKGLRAPDYGELMTAFDQLNLGFSYTIASIQQGYEAHMPFNFGRAKFQRKNRPSNYGRYSGNTIGSATLGLLCNAYTQEQQKAILRRMIQHGIQWYDTLTNEGTVLTEDGGHFQFHHVPIISALMFTGRSDKINTLHQTLPGNVLGQPIKIDKQFLADLLPHNDGTKPATSRRRLLGPGSVDGNTITIPTKRVNYQFDPYRLQLVNMFLTRESDGAQALVTDMPNGVVPETNAESSLQIIIGQQPPSPFKAGDVIYFTPGYAIREGDYDWSIKDGKSNWYRPNAPISYRNLNFWVEEYFFFKVLGLEHPSFENVYGYVERANQQGIPSRLIDFAPHFDTSFAESFWKKYHGATQ